MSEKIGWPIWLNDTEFPISFSNFDRYYIAVLEQEKKTLAGKIGWISFYRNMIAVFIIIGIIHIFFYLLPCLHIYLTGNHMLPLDINHGFILIVVLILIIFLFMGYHAQIKSNGSYLWDAYRRYELGKDLYAKYGDLSLSLDIKDEMKQKAMEYIVDKWILAIDHSLKSTSAKLLTKVEHIFRDTFKEKCSNIVLKDLDKEKDRVKMELVTAYAYWYNGDFQQVFYATLMLLDNTYNLKKIDNLLYNIIYFGSYKWGILTYLKNSKNCIIRWSLKPIRIKYEKIKNLKKLYCKWNAHTSSWKKYREIEWKIIRGHYLIEKEFRLDDAMEEIEDCLKNRKWTNDNNADYNNQNKKNNVKSIPKQEDIKINNLSFEQKDYSILEKKNSVADLIWESVDEYLYSFKKISTLLKCLNEIKVKKDDYFLQYNENLKKNEFENDKYQKDKIHSNIYFDFKYIKFVCNKYNIEDYSNYEKIKEKIQMYDRLEYIYYLFGNYEYSNAAKESTYLSENFRSSTTNEHLCYG
ncbi:MAG TPA: hypothetical protein VN704_07595, partial [Verrucomicrobiae bacterium]|nr:hypothetical protein [Verrucomicrobiae bacterium]